MTFLICDSGVAVPLQPTVNCFAEAFILINYLYLVILDDSIRQGWMVFFELLLVCVVQRLDISYMKTRPYIIEPCVNINTITDICSF